MGKLLHLFNNAADNDIENDNLNEKEKEHARTRAKLICSSNTIQHVFWGPIPLCRQTAETMMDTVANFADAQTHDPILGLGTRETLQRVMTPDMISRLSNRRHTMLQTLTEHIDHHLLSEIIDEAEASLQHMLKAMKNQETAYGFFHEPFISILAHAYNQNYDRALRPLGSLEFIRSIGGIILVN